MMDVNVTEVYIGIQGAGKSYAATVSALKLASQYDCPIVIHDPGNAPIRKSENAELYQLDWEVYHTPQPSSHFKYSHSARICVVNTARAEDAIAYAFAVKGAGPAVLLIDEVVASDKIKKGGIYAPWSDLIAQRRKYKLILIFCMQEPSMASKFLVATSTAVKCFRLDHKKYRANLEDMGYTAEEIERIFKLKEREHVELKKGFTK